MPHFAILTLPDAGHLYPLCALGDELVRRGHRVTVIAEPRAAPLVAQLGLPFTPLETDHIPYSESRILPLAFRLFDATWLVSLRDGFRWEVEAILQLVPEIIKELEVDGIVTDQIISAGGTAAERAGVPFVTVCTAPPWNEDFTLPPAFTGWQYQEGRRAQWRNRLGYLGWRWFCRPTLNAINGYRKAWELRPFSRIDDSYSTLAQITQLIPELDFPRPGKPPHMHYVGSLSADRARGDQEFPWERLDGRPLIYASLGTVADPMNRPVYPRIAAACAGLDAQLVLARGKWTDEDDGREESHNLAGQPLVVDYAPQLALLDRAAVLVTHAGLNTTLEAISCGVPIVAMPRSADQPGNAARIEYSGAGLRAPFHRGTPGQLRSVIERVLCHERFRQRARELQQSMRAAGGLSRASNIVEQALNTRRPVTQ